MRKALRILVKLVLALVVLALLAGVAGYVYITSQRGLDMIATRGSALASSDGMIVSIDGMSGSLFSDLSVRAVTVADADGVWLELHGVRVQWAPRQLLRKQPPLQVVHADEILLARLPKPAAEEAAKPAEASSGSMSLKEIAAYLPKEIFIGQFWVKPEVAGVEQKLALNGGDNADSYALHLKTIEGVETALDLTVVPRERDFDLQLTFREAPAGIVGALAGLPSDTALALDAKGAADVDGAIRLTEARVAAGTLTVQANAMYQPKDGAMDVNAVLNAPDMELAQAMSGTAMSGSVAATVGVKGTLDALQLALKVESPHLVVDQNTLDALLVDAAGSANVSAWGTDGFTAEGTIEANTHYDGKPAKFAAHITDADATLTIKQLAASYADMGITGDIVAKGSPEVFDLTADTALTSPFGASTLKLDGKVDVPQKQYVGKTAGKFTYLKETFDFAAEVDATDARASLKQLSLKGPGATVAGAVDVKIAEQLADGKLTIRAGDLAPLGRLLRQPLAGAVNADVVLASNGSKQRVDAKATAEKLQAAGIRIGRAELVAKADDVKTLDVIAADVKAQSVVTGTTIVDSLVASAKGSLKKGLAIALEGKGSADKQPWALKLAGQAEQPAENQAVLQLKTLEGKFANAPMRLEAPATMRYAPTRSELTPFTLAVAEGTVRAKGVMTPASVSGEVVINHVALDKLPTLALPKGKLDGTLTLAGSAKAPALTWKASTALVMETIPLNVAAHGDWKNGTLNNTATVTSDKANATAVVALKAPLTLEPFNAGINDATKLAGEVKLQLPLSMFNAQLRPSGNRVSGDVSGQASLQGTLGKPSFNGKFTLANGSYDQNDTGICLRDMNATITGTQQAVSLDDFHATDNDKNKFTANGKLALTGTQTFSGGAKFDQFRLFCGGMASGDIDGTLKASGTPQAMTVAGKLALGPLNVQIPGNNASSNIPSVDAQWVKAGAKQEAAAKPSIVALDIAIDVPNQLFVRGRGLDAEFAGGLRITGTADKPSIIGSLERKRGKFTLFDRVLSLETATLRFEGAVPPSPYLDVKADTVVNNTTISVLLSGAAVKPKLSLTSTPALPQDELLAQLLFGRQLDKISPFQAIKLAQATRTLAGMDSGPDMLGKIRDTLGLDALDVGSSDGGGVSVTTGKYLTDKVFVGVTQGTMPEDRKVTTEINLAPSISGKTAVDAGGNQSVGVDWKHDY